MSVTTRGQRRAMTVGVFVVVVCMAFESVGVATAMPEAAKELNGLPLYAWVFSLFVVGMLTATVVAGRVADRVGPIAPAMVGLAVFAAGLLIGGTAPTMELLLLARFVQGVGVGVANLSLTVLIALSYPEEERPQVMTWISTAWVLPALVGPPVAAWLTETFSWHWVFLVILPMLAAATVIPQLRRLSKVLDGQHDGPSNSVPMWSGFALAVGAVLLQLAGQRYGDGHRGLVEAAMAVAAVAVLLFTLPRMMPAGFLRLRRGLASVVWSRALAAGAFFGADAFIPLMLVQTRGLSLQLAGLMITVGSIGWTVGSWLQAQPWLRIPRHLLIVIGQGLVTVGCLGMAAAAWFSDGWLILVGLAWIPAGLGMGLAVSSTSLATMSLSPTAEQGRNSASLQVGEALGNSVIVGIAGSVFATLHLTQTPQLTFTVSMATMMLFAALGALLATRIGRIRSVN